MCPPGAGSPRPSPGPGKMPHALSCVPHCAQLRPRSTNPAQAAPAPCRTPRLPPLPEPKGGPSHRQEGRPGRGQQRQLPPTAPLQLRLETFWPEGSSGETDHGRRAVATVRPRGSHQGAAGPALVADTSGLPQGAWSSGFLPRSQGQREGGTPTHMATAPLSRAQSPKDNRGSHRLSGGNAAIERVFQPPGASTRPSETYSTETGREDGTSMGGRGTGPRTGNGRKHRRMEGGREGWTDRQTGGGVDGRTDDWMCRCR